MKLVEILKILRNENITIDYLGYNETNSLIDEIINHPKLIEEIEQIPDSFWEEAKSNGLLFYSELLWKYNSNKGLSLSRRYQDDKESGKNHIGALVLQKRRRG